MNFNTNLVKKNKNDKKYEYLSFYIKEEKSI